MEYSKDIDYKKCKFISCGTWFDKGTDAILITELTENTGIFKGILNGDLDEELCPFEEFAIFNNAGALLYPATDY